MKKPYKVLESYRVGQRWFHPDPKSEPVELTAAEAQYPLSRGWIEPVKTKTTKQVNADAAE